MTSHELARKLLDGDDLPVHFAYPFGDYWRTTVAPEITEVSDGPVRYSEYHQMPKVVEEGNEREDDTPDGKDTVVIILS